MEKINYKVRRKIAIFLAIVFCLIFIILMLFTPTITKDIIKNKTNAVFISSSQFDNNKDKYRDLDKSGDGESYILYENGKALYNNTIHDLEHIFCKEWAKEQGKEDCVNDPYNIRLCQKVVNNKRSDGYYGEVASKQDSEKVRNNNNEIVGYLQTVNGTSVFEPVYDKGDIARAIIYMCIVYGLDYPYLDTMKKWAKEKPGDDEKNHSSSIKNSTYKEFENKNNILISKYKYGSLLVF